MLHGSRQNVNGPGKIPLSEILIYWDHFPLDDKEDFLYIMQIVDNAYLDAYWNDPKNKPKESK